MIVLSDLQPPPLESALGPVTGDYAAAMRRWMIGASVLVVYWALWSLATVGWLADGHATWVVLLILGFTLLLPTALIALINRWWAPSLVLALPAVLLVPERCVTKQDFDAIGGTCSGFSDQLSVWLALAFGALLVGAAAVACLRWATGNPRRRPAETQAKPA
jgi:hypothetical protein